MTTFIRLWISFDNKSKFFVQPITIIKMLGGATEADQYNVSIMYTECGKTIVEVIMPDRNLLTVRELLRKELRNIRSQAQCNVTMIMEIIGKRLVV